MNRIIKFRGISEATNNWVYGYYFYDETLNESFIKFQNGNCCSIIDKTVGQFTGMLYKSLKECFEGDICFSEEATQLGDSRIWYVCTWIKEWGRFAWLNVVGEYEEYVDNGIENLDYTLQETYSLEDTCEYHYAGNIHENKDILLKIQTGNFKL